MEKESTINDFFYCSYYYDINGKILFSFLCFLKKKQILIFKVHFMHAKIKRAPFCIYVNLLVFYDVIKNVSTTI